MLLYAASVGMLLVAELMLSRSASPSAFGEYQYIRQSVPLITAGVLFGVDQALTRQLALGESFNAVRQIVRACSVLTIAVAALVALVSYNAYGMSTIGAASLMLAPIFLVASEISAAVLRARRNYAIAVLAQQGYRLVGGAGILAAVALSLPPELSYATLAVAACLVGIWAFLRMTRMLPADRATRSDVRRLRVLGAGYGVSMMSMALVDWMDQATVAYVFGSLSDSGSYAAVKLVAVYPFVTIASVLGFMVLPEVVRRQYLFTPRFWRRALVAMLVGCTAIWVVSALLLARVVPVALSREVDPLPIYILAGVGALRVAYILPSSVVGAFGSARLLGWSGGAGFAAAFVGAVTIYATADDGPIVAGAIGLLVATAVRLAIALVAAGRAVAMSRQGKDSILHDAS